MHTIPENAAVQEIAKKVLSELPEVIHSDSTEQSIAAFATQRLAELGATGTWYYCCPALVLLGSRSCLSISGKDYTPSDETVGGMNLISVDLSPCIGKVWGDCSRSFAVEGGRVVADIRSTDLSRGFEMQQLIHDELVKFATPGVTFHDLYCFANECISSNGYENLDFLGNLGHSIASSLDDRIFIEQNNHERLGNVSCFTFEPHLRPIGGTWGFKHENIYFFDENDRLTEL